MTKWQNVIIIALNILPTKLITATHGSRKESVQILSLLASPRTRPLCRHCLSAQILGFKKHHLLQCLVVLFAIDSWNFQFTKYTCSKDQTFVNLQYVSKDKEWHWTKNDHKTQCYHQYDNGWWHFSTNLIKFLILFFSIQHIMQ